MKTAARNISVLMVFLMLSGGGARRAFAQDASVAEPAASGVEATEVDDGLDDAAVIQGSPTDQMRPDRAERPPEPANIRGRANFFPPLSLEECLRLIDETIRMVPLRTAESEVLDSSLESRIRTCFNYLQFRDDLHTSLANYAWVKLDQGRVQHNLGEADSDEFTFSPPEKYVSALSFEAEGGDVWLHQIHVWDEKGKLRATTTFDNRILKELLPRREVFHLWRRTTVSKIEIIYSRANPNIDERPKVVIYGGKTDRPEYIKTSLHRLALASEELRRNNPDPAVVRDHLFDAREKIQSYMEREAAGE